MSGFFMLIVCSLNAQIGIAVAKTNESVVEWSVSWGKGSSLDCKMDARQKLIDKGYKNVSTLDGDDCCGHTIKSGYYVVVEGVAESDGESYIQEYGLGASSISYSEAEARAVKNLSVYANHWKPNDGYKTNKRGTF